ncbi:hypothetical protein HK104_011430 [Borealophlyctis nickersoniae]|nr:hypothetical protein HK104_011430 [Borealophlyctis nickersoniae]
MSASAPETVSVEELLSELEHILKDTLSQASLSWGPTQTGRIHGVPNFLHPLSLNIPELKHRYADLCDRVGTALTTFRDGTLNEAVAAAAAGGQSGDMMAAQNAAAMGQQLAEYTRLLKVGA